MPAVSCCRTFVPHRPDLMYSHCVHHMMQSIDMFDARIIYERSTDIDRPPHNITARTDMVKRGFVIRGHDNVLLRSDEESMVVLSAHMSTRRSTERRTTGRLATRGRRALHRSHITPPVMTALRTCSAVDWCVVFAGVRFALPALQGHARPGSVPSSCV